MPYRVLVDGLCLADLLSFTRDVDYVYLLNFPVFGICLSVAAAWNVNDFDGHNSLAWLAVVAASNVDNLNWELANIALPATAGSDIDYLNRVSFNRTVSSAVKWTNVLPNLH